MHFQDSLLKLAIPKLEDTLKRVSVILLPVCVLSEPILSFKMATWSA